MRLKTRIEHLEVKRTPAHLGLIFLTPQGFRDAHDRPLSPAAAEGAKIIVGIDPREV